MKKIISSDTKSDLVIKRLANLTQWTSTDEDFYKSFAENLAPLVIHPIKKNSVILKSIDDKAKNRNKISSIPNSNDSDIDDDTYSRNPGCRSRTRLRKSVIKDKPVTKRKSV